MSDRKRTLTLGSKLKTLVMDVENIHIKLLETDSIVNCKDVFAFVDANNTTYRLVAGKLLQCLNRDAELQLYKTESKRIQGKITFTDTEYYFTRNPLNEMCLLNMGNLLRVFSDDLAYCLLLELYFSSTTSLIEYDHLHNTYKVCRLRQLSKQVLLKN